MSYGGGVYNAHSDATSITVNCDAPTRSIDTELDSRPKKHVIVKPRVSSANGVYELLQCPVCSSSMYPPITQVSDLSPLTYMQFSVISLNACLSLFKDT